MPEKDPITPISLLATLLLTAGFVMLYLLPEEQISSPIKDSQPAARSPFIEPKPVPLPPLKPEATNHIELPEIPELTAEELQQLSPEERIRYETLRASLQQTLQNVQQLEQENADLQQQLEQGIQTNQSLDKEIQQVRETVEKPAINEN